MCLADGFNITAYILFLSVKGAKIGQLPEFCINHGKLQPEQQNLDNLLAQDVITMCAIYPHTPNPSISMATPLDQARQVLRARHYSSRTEQACLDRMRRFNLFHGTGDGALEVQAFLAHLALEKNSPPPPKTP
jgi:hypothetical protein